jgi:hypothetical protein
MSIKTTAAVKGGQEAGTLAGGGTLGVAMVFLAKRFDIDLSAEEAAAFVAAISLVVGVVGRVGGQIMKAFKKE